MATQLYLPAAVVRRMRDPRQGYKTSTQDTQVRTDTAKAVETEHWYGEHDVRIAPQTVRGVVRQAPDGRFGELELNLPGDVRIWIPKEAIEEWKAKYG